MRKIDKHIVHCSDSLAGDVSEIRRWHIARGWADVGYHFIIRRDGEIEVGRTLDQVGAHCEGHNATSVGTCLIGKTHFTLMQFASLQRVNTMLEELFSEIKVFGHCDFNPHKTCPNFDVQQILKG
jgi:N-acetylmuramoyl-L-alanine amidase